MMTRTKLAIGAVGAGLVLSVWGITGAVHGATTQTRPGQHFSQQPSPPDSCLAGCTSLSSTHHAAITDYPKIRAQFVGSRWPDLRTTGTAYADLAVRLRSARGTDGYETVWFHQRLAAACARHGAAAERQRLSA